MDKTSEFVVCTLNCCAIYVAVQYVHAASSGTDQWQWLVYEPAVLLCTLDKDKLSALCFMAHAMAQIVGQWLLLWRLWFSPRPVHMVFVVDSVALGQVPLNT